MAEPVDAIRAVHHAFRNDLKRIDEAAFDAAKGKEGLAGTIERYRFFNEMLVWHAKGEEVAVFPAIESVAPLVASQSGRRGMESFSPLPLPAGTRCIKTLQLRAVPPAIPEIHQPEREQTGRETRNGPEE